MIDIYFPSAALSNNLPVMITFNITDHDGKICYNQSLQLTCHANTINVTQYSWISTTFEQAKDTASITVVATHDPVEYKCVVTGTNGESGYSSVNVSSNGEFLVACRIRKNIRVGELTWFSQFFTQLHIFSHELPKGALVNGLVYQ